MIEKLKILISNGIENTDIEVLQYLHNINLTRLTEYLNNNKQETLAKQYRDFRENYKTCKICNTLFKSTKKYGICDNENCRIEYQKKWDFRNSISKEVWKEKYGVDNPSKSKIISEKKRQTFSKNFGTPEKLNELILRRKNTNLKKYGYTSPFDNENIKLKVKNSLLEKYGVDNISKLDYIKDQKKQTCLKNFGVLISTQRHIKNYDDYCNKDFWIKNFNTNGVYDFEKIMDYFGIQDYTVIEKLNNFGIKFNKKPYKCKTQMNIFNNIKCENKILNDRKVLDGKEIDIFLPDYKVGIEYNGLMFHSQGISVYKTFNTPDYNKNYHLEKLENCLKAGIQLYTIFEGENLDLWLSMINNKLKLNTKVYARDCFVKPLGNNEVKDFLNDNHIQGFINAKIVLGLFINQNKEKSYNFTKVNGKENPSLGLNNTKENNASKLVNSNIANNANNTKNTTQVDNGILVSVMTFSKPRFNKKYDYELIRFCSLKGYSIIGGASKLFKYFLRNYGAKKIISYANRRFSQGNIYEVLGFKKIGVSTPNYFYFKEDDFTLFSRVKFQKHKLSKILPKYNKNLTESENMFNNGYRRIFDCGNLIYEYNL